MFNIAVCDDDVVLCSWIDETLLCNKTNLLLPYTLTVYHSGTSLCKQLDAGIQCR